MIVRAPINNQFQDVTLDCAGVLQGWKPIGAYQYVDIALSKDDFKPQIYSGGTCDTGIHRITTTGKITATLWSWGSRVTYPTRYTEAIGYAFVLGGATVTPTQPIEPP